MEIKKILVPLDGSALAEEAIAKAIEFTRSAEPTLTLLRAAEAPTMPGVDPTDAQVTVVREAEEYLAGVAARLKARGITRVETSVWYGPAALSIVEAARYRKADLIVMSTHGRTGLGRLILGSVAESVLRGTTTPILLLRAAEAPVQAPAGSGQARPASERQAV
ncbi:MAG TPA: universal stress protein [Candidatus Methylomirabilis sp.]|nr:universal stress protein [Candidatus Methylomirabilis sp.]